MFLEDRYGMVVCQDVELMLQDYLDGNLLPSQKEVLERHLRACGPCRELLQGVMRLDEGLERVGEVEVPGGLTASIIRALPPPAPPPSGLRRAFTLAAAPLAALAVLGLGFLLRERHSLQDRRGERRVEIVYAAPQAASVAIAGDFNGWDPARTRMVRSGHAGVWRARLTLPPGVYQYSFVIDGSTWVRDPQAKTATDDGFGGENSVMVVDG
jgi:anti-sigma factor RsiW